MAGLQAYVCVCRDSAIVQEAAGTWLLPVQ